MTSQCVDLSTQTHKHTDNTCSKGYDNPIDWASIELSDGVFDFSSALSGWTAAITAGFRIETALMTGAVAPAWLRTVQVKMLPGHGCNGVVDHDVTAEAKPGNDGNGDGDTICLWPDYMDPVYQSKYFRAISKFAEYIGSLPNQTRSQIVAV